MHIDSGKAVESMEPTSPTTPTTESDMRDEGTHIRKKKNINNKMIETRNERNNGEK